MPEFDPPECDEGHPAVEMSFLESYDPMADRGDPGPPGSGADTTEWQERWKYACPDCGRVVEVREAVGGGFETRTVEESRSGRRDDPTSLSPVAEWKDDE